jgi:hypothetical protein
MLDSNGLSTENTRKWVACMRVTVKMTLGTNGWGKWIASQSSERQYTRCCRQAMSQKS